jgi:hypothetical protein
VKKNYKTQSPINIMLKKRIEIEKSIKKGLKETTLVNSG